MCIIARHTKVLVTAHRTLIVQKFLCNLNFQFHVNCVYHTQCVQIFPCLVLLYDCSIFVFYFMYITLVWCASMTPQ